jgi:hypothetical protein
LADDHTGVADAPVGSTRSQASSWTVPAAEQRR